MGCTGCMGRALPHARLGPAEGCGWPCCTCWAPCHTTPLPIVYAAAASATSAAAAASAAAGTHGPSGSGLATAAGSHHRANMSLLPLQGNTLVCHQNMGAAPGSGANRSPLAPALRGLGPRSAHAAIYGTQQTCVSYSETWTPISHHWGGTPCRGSLHGLVPLALY